MDKRPTMKDVARAAGVSHMTVSRVVNGDGGVRPTTAARVAEAVRRLGYQRNDMARSLRVKRQTTGTIGLVLDDVANPFWSVLTRAVEDEAHRRGHLVLVGSTNDDRQRERAIVSAFCARRVDGLVVVPVAGGTHELLRAQVALGTPVVCVDRPADGLDVDTVVVDNRAGARRAVDHLLAHGHRRIGFVGDRPGIWTAEERYRGYQEALAAAGEAVDPALVRRGVRTVGEAAAAVASLATLASPPTALFAGNNVITMGAVTAPSAQGGRPALVGFDDFPLAGRLDPPVTVVAQDPGVLGAAAAGLLFRRLAGEGAATRRVVLATRLVPRGSGEIPGPRR